MSNIFGFKKTKYVFLRDLKVLLIFYESNPPRLNTEKKLSIYEKVRWKSRHTCFLNCFPIIFKDCLLSEQADVKNEDDLHSDGRHLGCQHVATNIKDYLLSIQAEVQNEDDLFSDGRHLGCQHGNGGCSFSGGKSLYPPKEWQKNIGGGSGFPSCQIQIPNQLG